MPRDKTINHIRLMAAAREEFLAFGFEKASMRSIGNRCGLTAAGIYRHCKDKEDLFDKLVAPAADRLNTWLREHAARYVDTAENRREPLWQDSWIDMMRELVYPCMEDYHLLLAKSHGTKYENFLHDLTENGQSQFLAYFPLLKELGYPVRDIHPSELHLLLSAYSTALFEPVIHNYPLKDALRCLDTIEAFFLPGWKSIAVTWAFGYLFNSSPAFRPPPQPRSTAFSGVISGRCVKPQSANLACPEFIPLSIIFPRKPSGFRV